MVQSDLIYVGQSREEIPSDVKYVKVDPSVKAIDTMAFQECCELIHVELPEGLERIGDNSFHLCTSLERINIPSGVLVICEAAFYDCTMLMNVELCEGLEQISKMAFMECHSLTSISIPSTVKEIGQEAFSRCYNLKFVVLREGLQKIDKLAFNGCESLKSVSIPSTVKHVYPCAFLCCVSLETIKFCTEIEQFVDEVSLRDWWDYNNRWDDMPSGLSLSMFNFLAEKNIPVRLGKIKQSWKNNICGMMQDIPAKLGSRGDLDILDGFFFFEYIESLLSNYEHLQKVAPILQLALRKAVMEEQSSGTLVNEEMYLYHSLKRAKVTIPDAQCSDNLMNEEVKQQSHINFLEMAKGIVPNVLSFLTPLMEQNPTFFYSGQLRSRTDVTHVKVDQSVKEICDDAFSECRKLMNVELNEGLERIGTGAFHSCTSLEKINIPSSVKLISEGAFSDCILRDVTLWEGLECICKEAFLDCTSLESIRIPSTVNVIGEDAFGGCSNLRYVDLCEGLVKIDQYAFRECVLLTSIRIPSTVKFMDHTVFNDCSGLETIDFCEEIEQFVNDMLLREWWNVTQSGLSLITFSYFVRCNIPVRFGKIKNEIWKQDICQLLQHIPDEFPDASLDDDDDVEHQYYFDSIESRLSKYEHLQNVELIILKCALWKLEIIEEQSCGTFINQEMKLQCRYNLFDGVGIIIQNVFSFL